MGNAAAGGSEQEPADGREARSSAGSASGMSDPTPTLQKKQPAPPKLPVPPEEELEERFNVVLVSQGWVAEFDPDREKQTSSHVRAAKWPINLKLSGSPFGIIHAE